VNMICSQHKTRLKRVRLPLQINASACKSESQFA
jgi:hypothetical protein